MSNYPDGCRNLLPQDEQPSANERYEARMRGDARCDLAALAEEVGKTLRGLDLSNHAIACVSEQLCEQLLDHQSYRAAFADCGDGHAIAERVMIRAAAKQEAA